jgi:hypothetical protein
LKRHAQLEASAISLERTSTFASLPARDKEGRSALFLAAHTGEIPEASALDARLLFLRAVDFVAHEVLADLRESCCPALLELTTRKHADFPHHAPNSIFGWSVVTHARRAVWLMECLQEWSKRWHLSDPWCLDAASQTLTYWRTHKPEGWYWRASSSSLYLLDIMEGRSNRFLPTPPTLPSWNPEECTSSKYLERASAIERRYVAEVERSSKLKPVSKKRSNAHFDWLAGFQVRCWSKNKMAKALGMSQSAVVEAIQSTAAFISLELRDPDENDPSESVDRIREALKTSPPIRR